MAPRRNTKIPEKEWEVRKDLIRRLYLDENRKLMGSDGVIETMKGHGFSAR